MRGLHRVLNMPQNALIVAQYVWLCLNNAEYHWICRHIPEKIENWICQNSDAVQSIRSLYQLQSRAVIMTKTYLEHCQTTFKMDRFTKKIACVQVGNQKFFRATKKKKKTKKSGVKLPNSTNISSSKRGSAGNNIWVFYPRYS